MLEHFFPFERPEAVAHYGKPVKLADEEAIIDLRLGSGRWCRSGLACGLRSYSSSRHSEYQGCGISLSFRQDRALYCLEAGLEQLYWMELAHYKAHGRYFDPTDSREGQIGLGYTSAIGRCESARRNFGLSCAPI